MLYRHDRYLNKNIPYIISNEIVEYDMQSAGFNLIKKFRLLDDNKIAYLETLPKKDRHIQIGWYQRKDKEFRIALRDKFIEARKWFFENNELKDDEVLSIKKDAVVTLRRCHVLEWGNVIFAEKNLYTSYYHLNNFEFYYNGNVGIDVKGIDDETLELHRDYMLDFLFNFFKLVEISTKKKTIEMLKSFNHYYKAKQLDVGYYRELDEKSLYRVSEKLFGKQIGMREVGSLKNVEIGYNQANYIIPLISILL